jgi:hypothetical protein
MMAIHILEGVTLQVAVVNSITKRTYTLKEKFAGVCGLVNALLEGEQKNSGKIMTTGEVYGRTIKIQIDN